MAITHCNVITMKSDKVLHNQTVLLSHERISAILPSEKWNNSQNNNLTFIDAQGKYLLPALTEMHTHGSGYSKWVFNLFFYYGVTTIRFMAGNEALLAWRDSINRNLMIAPDIHIASKLIDGNPPIWGQLHDGPVITQADSAELVVLDQMKQGYEFIKPYSRLSPGVYKKLLQVCHDNHIKVAGHIPVTIPKEDILSGQTGKIEHLSGYARIVSNIDTVSDSTLAANSDVSTDLELGRYYSVQKINAAARKTKALRIWNCPTLIIEGIKTDSNFCKSLPQSALGSKVAALLPWWKSQGYTISAEEYKYYQFKKAIVKALYQQGAILLAGTDSPPSHG